MNSLGKALSSPTPQPGHEDQPGNLSVRNDAPNRRDLLTRILDTPQLAQIVPQLQPELLQRIIVHCGLEDCSEVIALATPEQLAGVFDLDLWRAARPGLDEQFDAERFGVWLEVLLESGAAVAAQKLAGIAVDLVITGLAQHALVCDRAAITAYETLDGEQVEMSREDDDRLTADVGGYVLVARCTDSWDAIVEVLMALSEGHSAYFERVMQGCCALSNAGFEDDGLDTLLFAGEQAMLDVGVAREQRREQQGFVTPAQARAFLQMARALCLADDAAPPVNPLARAYFRNINEMTTDVNHAPGATGGGTAGTDAPLASAESGAGAAAVFNLLLDAGLIPQPPRALLEAGEERAPRLNHIRTRLEFAFDRDEVAYVNRNEELAYLANVLMAGCSLQTRSFTPQEASEAAIAVCNLGLENWPLRWLSANATALPISFLVERDLVSVFQVGWKVLYDNVGMYVAKQLGEILHELQCDDPEIQWGLNVLRQELTKCQQAGKPWQARDALDVLAILDTPSWAALLCFIDECPTLHAVSNASRNSQILSVSESDFTFISENSQIASVREFMRSLPETLES